MPPVLIAAGVTAAAGIGSAVIGSKAASKAAKAQTSSDQAAIDFQRETRDLNREDSAPWRIVGGQSVHNAYDMLQPGYDYTASPGYQWRLGQGEAAIQGSAASRGHLLSGGTLKDLASFGQGLAAQDYGDQFNRYSTLAGLGSSATSSNSGLAQNSANSIGNLLQAQGAARASGYQNQAGAIQGGLGNIATLANLYGGGGFGGGGGYGGFNYGGAFGNDVLTGGIQGNAGSLIPPYSLGL